MGKNKKGFNRKAREQKEIVIDNSSLSQIKVDLPSLKGRYDESNPLVLPSKKRTTKKKKTVTGHTQILSKKQRKKLEKLVEKKKKKLNRSEILEALAKVQAPLEELNQLTSISSVQTKGLKRHFADIENKSNDLIYPENHNETEATTLNSLSGSKRRKRILSAVLRKNKEENPIRDPNIVGFEDSASSSEEETDEEENSIKEIDIDIKSENDVEENGALDSNEKTISEGIVEKENESNFTVQDSSNADVEVISQNIKDKAVVIKKENSDSANVNKNTAHNPAVFVPVYRTPEIQATRMELPILAEEQTVMEVINENDVVIIAGETGSGKTTQVPQFLYEAGYASNDKMIGITQPRRVAAISMSKRVAEEMNLGTDIISFLIRFEGNVTENTKIKFMTDGVLLKEIQTDFTLSKYSVIILDEAHERNVYTDILIGLLSRIAPLRKKKNNPLKLIIMSATLRVEDFTQNTRLFRNPPPVVKVEARQYPVSVHFNKRTPADYLKECYHKAVKIHTKLPEGGILIFVTGQQEVNILVRKLRSFFPFTKEEKEGSDLESDLKESLENIKKNKKNRSVRLPKIDLDKYSVVPTDDTEGDLIADEDLDDFEEGETSEADQVLKACHQPLWVLPLYSLLPSSKQAKVFEKPPPNCRLCIVSTNVAETSLTIPNIKYVIDSGKTKTKLYDKVTGVSAYHVTWCSKASANQRAGRAGRIGPGHCYRLYSSAVFNDEFELFSIPEIQQKPVDDLVLQMKSMNIVKVVNFPFPTSPDIMQLKTAEKRLKILGALQNVPDQDEWSGKLTKLGETMASFPVSPRYAKMLALSYQHDLLQYTICIVAALSVQEVLLQNEEDNRWNRLRRIWAGTGNSLLLGDIMVLLRAVGAAECSKNNLEKFCEKNGLRHKAMVEIRKLRVQLTNQINLNIPDLNLIVDPNMKPPTDTQAKLLRQIVLSGMGDQVAHKVNPEEIANVEDKLKWKRAYRHCEMEEPIFMHSASVLKKEMPEWVVYQEVYETNKLYMRGVTAIEPEWLPIFVSELCNLSEPLTDPPPKFDRETGTVHCSIEGTFGKAAFPLPVVNIPYTTTLDSYKWFAMFLLNGEVFPKLKKFTTSLLSPPSVLKKSWAKLQPRTEILLKALVSKEINTRDSLLEAWKEDQYYLLSAYKTWLPESAHESLMAIWPPT